MLDVILHVLQVCEETRMVVKDFHKRLDILRACRKGDDDADIDDLVNWWRDLWKVWTTLNHSLNYSAIVKNAEKL